MKAAERAPLFPRVLGWYLATVILTDREHHRSHRAKSRCRACAMRKCPLDFAREDWCRPIIFTASKYELDAWDVSADQFTERGATEGSRIEIEGRIWRFTEEAGAHAGESHSR